MKNIIPIQLFLSFAVIFAFFQAQAQTKVNLGRPINNPQTSEQNPSLSGNGKYLILETDYGFEGYYPVISQQIAYMWSRPEEVSGIFSKLTNDRDWNFNYDGTQLFFASTRHGGIGSSDIWFSKKNSNSTWTTPVNLAKPLNSALSESGPSISADGRTLYFVRSNGQKTSEGKECGSIWVSTLKGNSWSEPQKLPAIINSGCECAPAILTDNQTLVFASTRAGGKGGLDLYKSVFKDNKWSAPSPLTFLNTANDDYAFAMYEKGDHAIITAIEHGKNDLFKIKVPEEFQPLPHKVWHGRVINSSTQKPIPAKIEALSKGNLNVANQLYTDGSSGYFQLVLNGDKKQFIRISPLAKEYFHELIEVSLDEDITDKISLIPLQKGHSKSLDLVEINHNYELTATAKLQLDQLVKCLQANPTLKIEIAVHANQVLIDSVFRDGLTEVDTIVSGKLSHAPVVDLNSSDSVDTAKIESKITKVTSYVYHNNRTQKEADRIKKYLISKGIQADRIIAKGYGDSKRKTFDPEKNRLVECIVL
jgi:Tol biopolymer transport system component